MEKLVVALMIGAFGFANAQTDQLLLLFLQQ